MSSFLSENKPSCFCTSLQEFPFAGHCCMHAQRSSHSTQVKKRKIRMAGDGKRCKRLIVYPDHPGMILQRPHGAPGPPNYLGRISNYLAMNSLPRNRRGHGPGYLPSLLSSCIPPVPLCSGTTCFPATAAHGVTVTTQQFIYFFYFSGLV